MQSLRSMKRGQRLTVGAVGRCPAALSALIPGKMGAELNVRSVRHSRPSAFARANVCAPEADWEPFVRWQTLAAQELKCSRSTPACGNGYGKGHQAVKQREIIA